MSLFHTEMTHRIVTFYEIDGFGAGGESRIERSPAAPALTHKGHVMTRNRAFRPGQDARLEDRVVLSHGHPAVHPASVLVRGLGNQGQSQQVSAAAQAVAALVNSAFDSFSSEFDQARALYFATSQTSPGGGVVAPWTSISAFSAYTTQRVQLLGQELVSTLHQAPLSKASARSLPGLVSGRIVNANPASASLLTSLNSSIPLSLTPGPLTTLYSLAEDSAIKTARISVLNIVDNASYTGGTHKR
jgi:hypothetical protein